VLEKPADAAGATAMLRALSGSSHRVHSAVAIFVAPPDGGDAGPPPADPAVAFVETSTVHFATLGEADIAAYVASGEPMDKAGSYGIQGAAGQFVSGIDGDYFNVVGLPVHRLSTALAALLRDGAVRSRGAAAP
jgi:septum formation protein